MPTSYVDIDRDEMEYVDGGATAHVIERSIDKRLISIPVNGIGWWFTGGLVAKGIGLLSSTIAKAIGAVASKSRIEYLVGGYTGSWFNFGEHLANYLDRIDRKPNNGRIDYLDTVYY